MLGQQANAPTARGHALAVLRIRGTALSIALLPTAIAIILITGGLTGQLGGAWDGLRRAVSAVALLTLAVAGVVAVTIARARPAITPTVPVSRAAAPDLYALVRDLAQRLDVPVPSAVALTPDCDAWLEDRTHRAHGTEGSGVAGGGPGGRRLRRRGREPAAPVLVIGSPFLWWMRVAELRALLAPVVAGTGPSAHPDIAAARRCVRSLDAAVAAADHARAAAILPDAAGQRGGVVRRTVLRFAGWIAKLMLRSCGPHTSEMERGVAAAAADRAKGTDRRLRMAAQEQVGLAYAGWDRLLNRVALPAWRTGRWPARLDAGVVSALTELSRRDRLAEDFTSRLGERPACDLLEEPGAIDESISLLAARLFHGDPKGKGAEWAPVDWSEYPEEVVDRIWRTEASRLFDALDTAGTSAGPPPATRTRAASSSAHAPSTPLVDGGGSDVDDAQHDAQHGDSSEHSAREAADTGDGRRRAVAAAMRTAVHMRAPDEAGPGPERTWGAAGAVSGERIRGGPPYGATLTRIIERLTHRGGPSYPNSPDPRLPGDPDSGNAGCDVAAGYGVGDGAADAARDDEVRDDGVERDGDAISARVSAAVAREQLARGAVPGTGPVAGGPLQPVDGLPQPMGLPLEPPRSGRELLAEHITAAVCCAAIDTAGAAPGLDWLDGPVLLVDGERSADLTRPVLALVEDGDPLPLRGWLARVGVRPDKPVRLI